MDGCVCLWELTVWYEEAPAKWRSQRRTDEVVLLHSEYPLYEVDAGISISFSFCSFPSVQTDTHISTSVPWGNFFNCMMIMMTTSLESLVSILSLTASVNPLDR